MAITKMKQLNDLLQNKGAKVLWLDICATLRKTVSSMSQFKRVGKHLVRK